MIHTYVKKLIENLPENITQKIISQQTGKTGRARN